MIVSKNILYLKYSDVESSNFIKLSYNCNKKDLLYSVVSSAKILNLQGITLFLILFNL